MILQNNTKCRICGKVFCCLKCRFKHEENTHVESLCPICNNQKIILRSSIDLKLIAHIAENHLPLHCVKCAKVYVSTSDMVNITNCLESKAKCRDQITSSIMQTSINPVLDNKVLTPTSIVNLQWKIRNKISEDYIGGSLSSLKNISVINNSGPSRNENNQGTVVRSTSTPMQGQGTAICDKQKETVFDSSGSYVSSIFASGSESEVSPPIVVLTPSSKPGILADRISKYHLGRSFNKKPVTPLRQVISNSIRRALTQHGMEHLKSAHLKPKKIFDNSSKCFDYSGSPLDLRTSPALRRVQSEIIERSCSFDHFNSSKTSTRQCLSISSKKTTESILIKSTSKSSAYTTCRSISVITSTELKEVSVEKDSNDKNPSTSSIKNSVTFTPKVVGGVIKKKTIEFKTPIQVNSTNDDDDDDVFYTPMSMRSNKNQNSTLSSDEHTNITDSFKTNSCNEVGNKYQTESNANQETNARTGKLWSMLTSMIQKSTYVNTTKKQEQRDNSQSFIKRCASFAGYIPKPKNLSDDDDEFQTLKRRRNTGTDSMETAAKRLKRIQGRKPINRMRKM